MIRHPRVGMDVEVQGDPRLWMIVGAAGDGKARIVCPELPGENVVVARLDQLREAWPGESPAVRLARRP